MPGVWGGSRLAAESEPSDDGAVARVVLLDQISKKTTALAHELEEAAAGVIVLWKALEMVRQALDSLCQEGDLDFRGSRVTLLGSELLNQLELLFPRERHSFLRTGTLSW